MTPIFSLFLYIVSMRIMAPVKWKSRSSYSSASRPTVHLCHQTLRSLLQWHLGAHTQHLPIIQGSRPRAGLSCNPLEVSEVADFFWKTSIPIEVFISLPYVLGPAKTL